MKLCHYHEPWTWHMNFTDTDNVNHNYTFNTSMKADHYAKAVTSTNEGNWYNMFGKTIKTIDISILPKKPTQGDKTYDGGIRFNMYFGDIDVTGKHTTQTTQSLSTKTKESEISSETTQAEPHTTKYVLMSTAAIALSVVGGIALLLLWILMVVFLKRLAIKRGREAEQERSRSARDGQLSMVTEGKQMTEPNTSDFFINPTEPSATYAEQAGTPGSARSMTPNQMMSPADGPSPASP